MIWLKVGWKVAVEDRWCDVLGSTEGQRSARSRVLVVKEGGELVTTSSVKDLQCGTVQNGKESSECVREREAENFDSWKNRFSGVQESIFFLNDSLADFFAERNLILLIIKFPFLFELLHCLTKHHSLRKRSAIILVALIRALTPHCRLMPEPRTLVTVIVVK